MFFPFFYLWHLLLAVAPHQSEHTSGFSGKKEKKITDDVVITKKSSIEYEAIGMTGLNFLLKFKCSRCPDDTQLLF